jgi:hypothetical protein
MSQEGQTGMSSECTIWVRVDAKLKYVAPVSLGLLIIYLYSSLVSPVLSKRILGYVEIAVITYFVSELVVKYVISDNYRQFLRDYWFDIVLLVPFFSSLRLLGAAGKVLKIYQRTRLHQVRPEGRQSTQDDSKKSVLHGQI